MVHRWAGSLRALAAPSALALSLVVPLTFDATGAQAQTPIRPDQADVTIDAATRATVLDGILAKLDARYVDPALAKRMRDDIARRRKRGEYDKITSAAAFGDSLTSELRAVSHDRHLAVRYSHEPVPVSSDSLTPAEAAREEEFNRVRNYGFEEVSRLRGNVGYIRLRGFAQGEEAYKAATAAMELLGHTDALIFDLRQNGGGSGEMVQYLCTYLVKAGDPVHLNDVYSRPDDFTQQFWTLPSITGARYTDREVYVLTSKRTFSAAEEFAYNLKNLKRATIVGETTGGGAHPVRFERLAENFEMSVPYAKSINPVSKTNWEGTGVAPDVAVGADDALKTAHKLALEHLKSTAADPQAIAQAIADLDKTGESKVPTTMPR